MPELVVDVTTFFECSYMYLLDSTRHLKYLYENTRHHNFTYFTYSTVLDITNIHMKRLLASQLSTLNLDDMKRIEGVCSQYLESFAFDLGREVGGSLLQNIVSFIGLFCKRVLYF